MLPGVALLTSSIALGVSAGFVEQVNSVAASVGENVAIPAYANLSIASSVISIVFLCLLYVFLAPDPFLKDISSQMR